MKFPYTKKILNKKDCLALKKIILKREESIKALGSDKYPGTSNNSLTGRYLIFNWLNDLEFRDIFLLKLKKFFVELDYSFPIIVQCWVNTFRAGEGIMPHQHGENIMSANIFICGDPNIGTKFLVNHRTKNIQSKEGNITIFPGTIPHYVMPNSLKSFNSHGIRISIAMDIYLDGLLPEPSIELDNKRYFKIK